MRRYDVISEICDAMLELGWAPYQNDHEDANGQFEMNWQFDDALATADRHGVLQIYGQGDRREAWACAPPSCRSRSPTSPAAAATCMSRCGKGGKNLFDDGNDGLGLSRTAYNFIGGVMNAAGEHLLDHQSHGQFL